MSKQKRISPRQLGLLDAIGIGVGAIVGGGILALAGVTFAATGPSAVLAFALNGLIALITALSFAELSTAFPQSGGTYLFAKRVLSVSAAFNVGWVVWFASIVAAALYALGFAAFALDGCTALCPHAPRWLGHPIAITLMALITTVSCTLYLCRTGNAGANWINILKIGVFGALILGGLWAWQRDRPPAVERLRPFLSRGMLGLAQAMGYSFIALQGFDLIAAAAGRIKQPRRVLPQAILLSLGIALVIYLPTLVLINVAGLAPGETLQAMAAQDPDSVVARAARVFLGPTGYWIVIVIGILSMFSALLANLYAAAHIAQAMAQDRTLPNRLERIHLQHGTPSTALWCTGILTCIILVLVHDVGRAGAAASLLFLVTFALAHLICILARLRKPNHTGFHTPWWPVLPGIGLVACMALAIFQGAAVPGAGLIAGTWLILGFFCFLWLFSRRARVYDAASESSDPDLLELRGRSPLVLVPIANPANAETMALLATCISPPRMGRVLLLNVAPFPDEEANGQALQTTAEILRLSMAAAMRARIRVESLATVANNPWKEIDRVARAHRCASVLLGMADLADDAIRQRLENLASRLPGNVVIFRGPPSWHPRTVRHVLVPIGGRVAHNALRARLLNGLYRRVEQDLHIQYLLVLPTTTDDGARLRAERLWTRLVSDETHAPSQVRILLNDNIPAAILAAAEPTDLVLLGLNKKDTHRRVFGSITTQVVQDVQTAVMVIGQRG
ncbi:APC family permease [Planctomycetota bacterium]